MKANSTVPLKVAAISHVSMRQSVAIQLSKEMKNVIKVVKILRNAILIWLERLVAKYRHVAMAISTLLLVSDVIREILTQSNAMESFVQLSFVEMAILIFVQEKNVTNLEEWTAQGAMASK